MLASMKRYVYLNPHDKLWQRHLDDMDHLRDSVRMVQHAQLDPLVQYKKEGHGLFSELIAKIDQEVAANLFSSSQRILEQHRMIEELRAQEQAEHQAIGQFGQAEGDEPLTQIVEGPDGQLYEVPVEMEAPKQQPVRKTEPKVGRNDPCPCGSGKKYKKCCGQQ